MQSDPAIEFSRILSFEQIGATGASYHVEANEEERRLLAKRFNLVAIHGLGAHFFLSHAQEPGCISIEGEVRGEVVQSCVSTLKDVPESVHAQVKILLRPSQGTAIDETFEIDLESDIDTEFYTDNVVDLGETAAQYLFLNLDPFPHAPDAPILSEEAKVEKSNSLIQALKKLKEQK
jgi:hypothetical protein